jgi:hypothetical protein
MRLGKALRVADGIILLIDGAQVLHYARPGLWDASGDATPQGTPA